MKGRPPLPPEQRRSVLLKTTVRPAGAARITHLADARGISVADAIREALVEWAQRQEQK